MRIEVKGRNVAVPEELVEHVEKRFRKVSRQVSELARLDVEVWEEPNPANSDRCVAEATLYLKGVVLRARDGSPDLMRSINLVGDEMAVQVKRHREKRRARRAARAAQAGAEEAAPTGPEGAAAEGAA